MRPLLTWLCASLLLVACAADVERSASHTVTDSAGITIVHSHAPAWSESERWTVAAEPFLEIGVVEGEEPYLLDRVVGAARLEDGRVAVAVAGDNTIRFYDSDGRYLDRVGGSGEGPGEFRQLISLLRIPGRLVGRQLASRPMNVFDETTGRFLETIPPPTVPGLQGSVQGVFDDGSLFLRGDPEGSLPESGAFDTWTSAAMRFTKAGVVDTLGVFSVGTFVSVGDGGATAQDFGPELKLLAGGDRFYQALTSRYEIAEHSLDGAVLRLIRRAWDPIPVTDEHISIRTEGMRARGTDDDWVAALVYPDHHPAFGSMRVDRAGRLWVQRIDPRRTREDEFFDRPGDAPAPWDVFSAEGVWLGAVEQPARFRFMEIGDDYVAGVWTDDLDVEFVRLYEIVKPVG